MIVPPTYESEKDEPFKVGSSWSRGDSYADDYSALPAPEHPDHLPSPYDSVQRGQSMRSVRSGETGNRLTYIDEDFNYYSNRPARDANATETQDSLVRNAADVGRSGNFQDMEYADPYYKPSGPVPYNNFGEAPNEVSRGKESPLQRFIGTGKYPLEQRIEDKKRGIGRQKHPFVGLSNFTLSLHCFN
jgi:hypothetical protein